jgi:flagellin
MSDITLGLATQQNLLALQNINQNLDTTQNALATGLKVSSAVDNAVAYFQAQSLDNRANDLTNRKSQIDQGISSITTATQGIQSAISILQQLQGIVQSAKTETKSQQAAAAVQFNQLAVQFNELINDASYQGLNLLNSTTSVLNLQFSTLSSSTFKVQGANLLASAGHLFSKGAGATAQAASALATALAGIKFSQVITGGSTSSYDTAFNKLNGAISIAQAEAQTLGGNVSLLQTRESFTAQYITTLSGGASKLTVADVNLESTNLVTLQTRQSLAIESLSIATSSEQAVLRLFR